MAEVALTGLTKFLSATRAVGAVTLIIPDSVFAVLLGPSGAGKATILRLIAGLERLDAGDALIAGRPVQPDSPAERDVAMVFQQYSLDPHMSVRDNLAVPLRSPSCACPNGRSRCAWSAWPRCCASRTSFPTRPPSCRAARCSA